jgi:replicative DNA helicase
MSDITKELELDNVEKLKLIDTENNKDNVAMEDFFQTSLDDIEEFDDEAWNKGDGLITPRFPYMCEKLEGWDNGLYLFTGKSNHGKTAALLNIMYDACSYEPNKLFGLYYSLDDSKKEVIPRLIAMEQNIPIGVVAKPRRYQNKIDNLEEGSSIYIEMLEKRASGLQKLKEEVNKIKIEDSNKIKNSDNIHDHITKVLTYLHSIDPEYKLMIGIDAINDVRLTYKPTDNNVPAEIARVVKQWTVEFNCPILASAHMRKLNGSRRPTMEDMFDSTVLSYEASVTFIVYNDVSENKQSAKIYQNVGADGYKRPILEFDWAKNKKSSYKGRTFCYFNPDYSKAIECDEEATKRFNALIYEV